MERNRRGPPLTYNKLPSVAAGFYSPYSSCLLSCTPASKVGILTYDVLLGHPPFESDAPEDTVSSILYTEPEFPHWLSADALSFLKAVRGWPTQGVPFIAHKPLACETQVALLVTLLPGVPHVHACGCAVGRWGGGVSRCCHQSSVLVSSRASK